MKRLNAEGEDVTAIVVAWDESDKVELSGFEYDQMLARLEAASMTVNNLKIKFEEIREAITKDKLKQPLIIPEHTGGVDFRKPRMN